MKAVETFFRAPEDDPAGPTHEDNIILQELGYKQELYRGFSYLMNFAFTFSAVSVLAGISVLFSIGLQTGGPVVMVWGWVIGATMTLVVASCMAEICSRYPQAGSVYYWSNQLAGEKWGPFASWICGWFNLIGNAAGDASYAMGFGQVVTAVSVLVAGCANEVSSASVASSVAASSVAASGSGSGSGDACGLTNEQTVGVAISGIFAMACLNIIRIDKLGIYNIFAAFWMMGSSLIIVIVALSLAPTHQTGAFVFSHYNNDTGIASNGYVCLIGLLTALFSFSGYEAGAHMAEETVDARKSAPKGIIHSVIAGIFSGLIYIICLLFAMQNLEGSANSATGNATIQILWDAAGHKAGLAMSAFLVITTFLAGLSSVTVTSRIAFAMVRDDAIPFAKYLKPVNKYTKEPIRMVAVTFTFSVALICTQLGSPTAFAAVTSITTIGYQISYMIPILLRCTVARKTFVKGPFHLGAFSIPMGLAASLWLLFTSILFVLPSTEPVTSETMNYACVMVGGILILVLFWWVLSAHKWFKPKRAKEGDAKLDSTESGTSSSKPIEINGLGESDYTTSRAVI